MVVITLTGRMETKVPQLSFNTLMERPVEQHDPRLPDLPSLVTAR